MEDEFEKRWSSISEHMLQLGPYNYVILYIIFYNISGNYFNYAQFENRKNQHHHTFETKIFYMKLQTILNYYKALIIYQQCYNTHFYK